MKYLKQFSIIITISFVGEILSKMIPLMIPSSIYGLFIMFIALETGILKLDSVKETGKFLIEIMPIMFIPAAVGLLESWSTLQSILIPVISITVISTVVVMVISGRFTQLIIRKGKKRGENNVK